MSSIAVDGSTVYFGTENGTFYASGTTRGELRWKYRTQSGGAEWTGPPRVTDGVVYGSVKNKHSPTEEGPGRAYAFDAASGERLWTYGTTYSASPVTSPRMNRLRLIDRSANASDTPNSSSARFRTGSTSCMVVVTVSYRPCNQVLWVRSLLGTPPCTRRRRAGGQRSPRRTLQAGMTTDAQKPRLSNPAGLRRLTRYHNCPYDGEQDCTALTR